MQDTNGPIGERWRKFRLEVLEASAGPEEVEEMQMAFYSGAAALMEHLRVRHGLAGVAARAVGRELDEFGEIALRAHDEAVDVLAAGATLGRSGKAN